MLILSVVNRRVSHDDQTIQIAVSVGCAYISFFVAQYILGTVCVFLHNMSYILVSILTLNMRIDSTLSIS